MSINANQKGKRFELRIAKDLAKKFDTNIRRTPNSGGLSIKGDILTTSGILSEYSWECKNQEKLKYLESIRTKQRRCKRHIKNSCSCIY